MIPSVAFLPLAPFDRNVCFYILRQAAVNGKTFACFVNKCPKAEDFPPLEPEMGLADVYMVQIKKI